MVCCKFRCALELTLRAAEKREAVPVTFADVVAPPELFRVLNDRETDPNVLVIDLRMPDEYKVRSARSGGSTYATQYSSIQPPVADSCRKINIPAALLRKEGIDAADIAAQLSDRNRAFGAPACTTCSDVAFSEFERRAEFDEVVLIAEGPVDLASAAAAHLAVRPGCIVLDTHPLSGCHVQVRGAQTTQGPAQDCAGRLRQLVSSLPDILHRHVHHAARRALIACRRAQVSRRGQAPSSTPR